MEPTPAPAVADAARVVAAPPPSGVVPDAATAADAAPASKGTWLDGKIYRFRFEDVRPCPPPPASAAARIGVVVRVTSNMNELLVAPRDFKLEAGGVILDSAIADKAPARCAPLLATKSLRTGKTTDGIVLFDIPPGFNTEQRPLKIAYQPTRWGGAKRVEALLPPGSLPQ